MRCNSSRVWHVTRKSSISLLCPSQKGEKTQPVSPSPVPFSSADIWHLFQRGRNLPLAASLWKLKKKMQQIFYLCKETFPTSSHWKDRNWRVALWEIIYCKRDTTTTWSLRASFESRKVRARFFFSSPFLFLHCFRLV